MALRFKDQLAAVKEGLAQAEAGDLTPLLRLVASGDLSTPDAADAARDRVLGESRITAWDTITAARGNEITPEQYEILWAAYKPTSEPACGAAE